MKHLKIMVKETKEERRALTREEYFAIWCCKYSDVANEFLKDSGYLNGSYEKPYLNCRICGYGYGTFRTETIREATPEEEEAWHYLKGVKTGANNILRGWSVGEAKQLLVGKEVYPELVEE